MCLIGSCRSRICVHNRRISVSETASALFLKSGMHTILYKLSFDRPKLCCADSM